MVGLISLHLEAVASFDGGQVFVEMQDSVTGVRIGHATMDIRYHAGGYEPRTVSPSEQVTMKMEFQAIDAIIPAGHGIRLVMTETGEDYLAPLCGNACPVHVITSMSTMTIPHIIRDSSTILITPQGEDAANN